MRRLSLGVLLADICAVIALISGNEPNNQVSDAPQLPIAKLGYGQLKLVYPLSTKDTDYATLQTANVEVRKHEQAGSIGLVYAKNYVSSTISHRNLHQDTLDNSVNEHTSTMSTVEESKEITTDEENHRKYIEFPFKSPNEVLQPSGENEPKLQVLYNKRRPNTNKYKESWANGNHMVLEANLNYKVLGSRLLEDDEASKPKIWPNHYVFKRETTEKLKSNISILASAIFIADTEKVCTRRKTPIHRYLHHYDEAARAKDKMKIQATEESMPNNENGANINMVDHKFYLSAVVKNATYFEEHWINVTTSADRMIVHPSTSNKAAGHVYIKQLRCGFPLFDRELRNIIILSNGYIHTGAGQHWVWSTQNISPLTANFDTSTSSAGAVIINEDNANGTHPYGTWKFRIKISLLITIVIQIYMILYCASEELP